MLLTFKNITTYLTFLSQWYWFQRTRLMLMFNIIICNVIKIFLIKHLFYFKTAKGRIGTVVLIWKRIDQNWVCCGVGVSVSSMMLLGRYTTLTVTLKEISERFALSKTLRLLHLVLLPFRINIYKTIRCYWKDNRENSD